MTGIRLDIQTFVCFDDAAVLRAVDKAKRKALGRAGSLVRTIARRSIKPAPRKKKKELTDDEKQRLAIQWSYYRAGRRKTKPKRPRWSTPSRPGQPPRSQTGLLRRFIFYGYDKTRDDVVVGPTRINKPTGAPAVLEYGGRVTIGRRTVSIAPRPYMGPALIKVQPKIAAFWRDAVHG